MSTTTDQQPRVAVVTGAGSGIGAACAQRLALDGHAVAVVDRDLDAARLTADLVTRDGGTAVAYGADVCDSPVVTSTVESIVTDLGPVGILVNNAGILRDAMLFKLAEEDWDSVIDVHLKGAYLFSRAAQRTMVEQRYGRIVNMSSTSALGNRGQANYAAAKAGIQGFTRTLALELGPFGVTVNAVGPGFIETAMTRSVAERTGADFEALRGRMAESVATRRTGQPSDVARAVSFLAAEDAGFITGQCLYVDGGLTLPSLPA
ncbi:3-oxoacyl-ACP reductase FabG [Nocardioides humi]|uniref:3-oxoacyl-ACP reductase FabG n=1 Tax=Nocardioides humi TaxID=449461 RepID=A0ABN1ZWI6_9ACTN|nr:3-oxoacyl-ACP reductase FabG [Nocardioides humi]